MESQNLSQRVKELRKRKALSQDELAKNAGLSLRTVQRVENGETIPTAETLKRLALILEVNPNELIDGDTFKDIPKRTIKTKYEYLHIFDSKLIFSKTPEINDLVKDYEKSVTSVFRTLMVFFVFIPIFLAMTIIFYNMKKMELVFYSGSFCLFFFIMAFYTMLFTSGTTTINVANITGIRIQKNIFQNSVILSFIESGRVKERGLPLEKDQVDPIINSLLSEQLIDEKDIKIKKNNTKIIITFLLPIFISILYYSIYDYNKGQIYFSGIFFGILSLSIIVKMIRNTIKPMDRAMDKTRF